jgi:hypothetical protein
LTGEGWGGGEQAQKVYAEENSLSSFTGLRRPHNDCLDGRSCRDALPLPDSRAFVKEPQNPG